MPARILVSFVLFLSLFITPVFAQTSEDVTTCKGESKSWDQIDSELRVAGYGGPFDHSQKELDVYNGAACPGTAPLAPGNTASSSPSGEITKLFKADGEALNDKNYDYLKHGQTSIEGSIGHTMFCSFAGVSPLGQCLGYKGIVNSKSGIIESAKPLVFDKLPNGGAFGGLAMINTAMYNTPPTSSVYYLAKVGNQFGVVPETAYAQVIGSGEGIIKPVERLWAVTRNMAYLIFVIIFMVVGLMVMFRRKLNPQTVITVQQALPTLVVGLVLVYFSYFIAALCVDVAFFGIQLVAQLFIEAHKTGTPNAIGSIQEASTNSNVFQLFSSAGLDGARTIFPAVKGQINTSGEQLFPGGGVLAPAAAGALAGAILGFGLPGAAVGALVGAFGQFIIPIILILIILTALFIQVFRLTFSLIMAYIQILVFTIGGPFLILIGSIPGQSGKISFWIRGILANALIFPAVFAAILFAGMVLGDTSSFTTSLPLLGGAGINSDLIRVMIAYGIILGSPAIPEMIRGFMKVKMDAAITNEAMGMFKTSQGIVTGNIGGAIGRGAVKAVYRAGEFAPAGSIRQRWRNNVRDRWGQTNWGKTYMNNKPTP